MLHETEERPPVGLKIGLLLRWPEEAVAAEELLPLPHPKGELRGVTLEEPNPLETLEVLETGVILTLELKPLATGWLRGSDLLAGGFTVATGT